MKILLVGAAGWLIAAAAVLVVVSVQVRLSSGTWPWQEENVCDQGSIGRVTEEQYNRKTRA